MYKKVFIKEKIKKEICEKVYCLNNNTHSFVCEGVIVHNCLGSYLSDRIVKLANAEENQDSEEKIYEIKSQIHKFIQWNLDLFGDDFYFEIAAGRSEEQIKLNRRIKPIVKAYGGKLVIGDDAHYLTAQDRQAHKIYLNSKNGDREVDAFYAYSHLMTNEEAYQNLSDIFSESEFQEMCQNSLDMQNKIGTYDIFRSPIIPHVTVKTYAKQKATPEIAKYHTLSSLVESNNDQERYWVNQCLQSLRDKNLWSDQYLARVEEEARIIKTVGNKLNNCLFEYFNTFQHYIDLFWNCGSIVGPGRGSSVCFLTNYLLGITQLDPIKWHLKEWRFLNDDRLELPDIDIDLNPTKRNKIFQEIRKERGELNLVQVCTWGTECTRSAIAAACRGYRSEEYPLGISPDEASYISSLVPIERGNLWEIKDCILGNESKGRRPVLEMVNALAEYPGLFEGICAIEGLVNKRGTHASGVMLYNNSFLDTNALMRSPNGDITTQFDLHDSEALGDTKFDFLATEICDKITLCIQMLQQDKLLDPNKSLHEIYYTHFHPEVINVKEPRLWEALGKGEVLDVFQFSTGVGLSAAKRIKPKNPTELTSANALMRLMGEEGAEKPIDRYCRLKDDMSMWYQEAAIAGLTSEEIKILEPYYLPNYGVPCAQEDLMEVCMDPNIAHFTLSEANYARKVVAKKKVNEVESLKEKFISQCPRRELGEYVWKTVAGPQMGYSFSTPHALAYSFVGIITLYLGVMFPSVYWNCACLIVNSGSTELLTSDDKGTTNTPNYGKISVALARSQQKGICIHLPDINKSGVTFEPEVQSNAIRYGIKGINSIGDDYVRLIMSKRPYNSINDFCEKTGLGKVQMMSLIKSGAFDSLYQGSRNKAMQEYLNILFPTKTKITLTQLNMLIYYDLIPE
ncbi:MAG: hypothetical protein LUC37_03575, partial [Prevotella sp.]|nr:hypothetical protein [Prevotella sp.]